MPPSLEAQVVGPCRGLIEHEVGGDVVSSRIADELRRELTGSRLTRLRATVGRVGLRLELGRPVCRLVVGELRLLEVVATFSAYGLLLGDLHLGSSATRSRPGRPSSAVLRRGVLTTAICTSFQEGYFVAALASRGTRPARHRGKSGADGERGPAASRARATRRGRRGARGASRRGRRAPLFPNRRHGEVRNPASRHALNTSNSSNADRRPRAKRPSADRNRAGSRGKPRGLLEAMAGHGLPAAPGRSGASVRRHISGRPPQLGDRGPGSDGAADADPHDFAFRCRSVCRPSVAGMPSAFHGPIVSVA